MTQAGDLHDKTVLLTGASGGIGAVTAAEILARGGHLIAHYATDETGAVAACSGAPADRWTTIRADLSVSGSARQLWRDALAWRGRIDVVVLNAAVMPDTPFDRDDDVWDEGWEQVMRVNVIEPATLARCALAHYRERGGGTIISLSSWAAQRGSAIPQLGAYAASKAAIRSITQTIARNYARDGVLAYVIAPGIVRTPMSEVSARHRGGADALNAELAMGRMVEPGEVARTVAFLASGMAPSLTGATLDVNGATYIR
jgi:NAD(P)-dependent dehydrogenase (short-subunit alcohol dehydrogenase family)